MKKTAILLMLCAALFVACSPSNEKKALACVEEIIKPTLKYPDSYKPVSIHVESANYSSIFNEDVYDDLGDFVNVLDKLEEITNRINDASLKMTFWSGLNASFARGQYKEAQQEMEKQTALLSKAQNKLQGLYNSIKEKDAAISESDLKGWMIFHRYSCLDEDGVANVAHDVVFMADKKYEYCSGYEKDKFDFGSGLISLIVNSDDLDDFYALLDEFMLVQ